MLTMHDLSLSFPFTGIFPGECWNAPSSPPLTAVTHFVTFSLASLALDLRSRRNKELQFENQSRSSGIYLGDVARSVSSYGSVVALSLRKFGRPNDAASRISF